MPEPPDSVSHYCRRAPADAGPLRAAFTLIELLVVIAIIALLVAILLPSLSKAKELAKAVRCTTNVRSIGMGWQLYLSDNNEAFPRLYAENTPGSFAARNMQWFYGGRQPCIYDDFHAPTGLAFRPLNPYLDQALKKETGTGLFSCPADGEVTHPITGASDTLGHTTYEYYGNSYMMTKWLLVPADESGAEQKDKTFYLKYVEIPYSQMAVAGDCQWYYAVNNSLWEAHFHNRRDKVNIVFLDGHAEYLQIVRGESATDDYSFWPYRVEEDPP